MVFSATTVVLLAVMGQTFGYRVPENSHKLSCLGCWPPSSSMVKKYYIESSIRDTWYGAYMHCVRNSSRMARVESKEENEELVQMMNTLRLPVFGYWIGGNDLAKEGQYSWLFMDQPVQYTNWHEGEPSNRGPYGDENCVAYGSEGWGDGYRWNDDRCKNELYFVCEYYADHVISFSSTNDPKL